MGSIAQRWKDLSGENQWDGLLDPLDVDLRRYIIQYGDKIHAVYDAFIDDKRSKNIGLPRYTKRNLFSKVGLVNGNPFEYLVTKYLYASSKLMFCHHHPAKATAGYSNWIGFVAVSSDAGTEALGRRDIVISFRGTSKEEEWCIDATIFFASASDILGKKDDPKLHSGWYTYYTRAEPGSTYNPTSLRDQVLAEVRELVDKYKDEEISITLTGHSMGGAFACMVATDIVYNGYNKPTGQPEKACQVTAFLFASPPVGNHGFSKVLSSLDKLHVLEVRNKPDIVSNLMFHFQDKPQIISNLRMFQLPGFLEILGYVHVGKKLEFNSQKSPYLKNPSKTAHNLEVYLHAIAGTQGTSPFAGFKLEVKRDIALLNKWEDVLKDEYNINAAWWREKIVSMIQLDDGSWVLNPFDREIDVNEDDEHELIPLNP
ncbi:hypothetical protein FNV43_RR09703 [Rhamnella rubrinervis]|uniref:Phospholipase A1 n=1 Tax=Rhamnella rubrinervis TaxID=2594499 RepID=A0A8K0HBR7_9ROSA|nr:hypothetical protein FNV43_RR09703 [Rhamnella rubrinervis]